VGLSQDKQRLLRVYNSDVEFIEGSEDSVIVRDCKLSDGSLIYVEELKVDSSGSCCESIFCRLTARPL
jgi:hypothetical protein